MCVYVLCYIYIYAIYVLISCSVCLYIHTYIYAYKLYWVYIILQHTISKNNLERKGFFTLHFQIIDHD